MSLFTSKYRLGQAYRRSFARMPYPRHIRREYLPRAAQINSQGVTQSLSVAQDIVVHAAWSRSLSQSFTVSQTIRLRLRDVPVELIQDVTIAQAITTRRVLNRLVSQSFTVADIPSNLATAIIQSFTVDQVIGLNVVKNFTVAQSFLVSDVLFLNSPRPVSLIQNFTVLDGIVDRNATIRVEVVQSATFTQFVTGRLGTFHVSVDQSFTVSQLLLRRDAIYNVSVTDSFTVTDRVNTQWAHSIEQDVTVTQLIAGAKEFIRSLTDSLTVAEDFDATRDLIYTLSDALGISESYPKNIIATTTLTDSLTPSESYGPIVFTQDSDHAASVGAPVVFGYLFVLTGVGTVVLPAPQFNDSQAAAAELNLRRAVSGRPVTYVKTTDEFVLAYDFILGLPKARELAAWIEANQDGRIRLTNHKAEIWDVQLTSGNPEFRAEGRWAGDDIEKVSVKLEFRGRRLLA